MIPDHRTPEPFVCCRPVWGAFLSLGMIFVLDAIWSATLSGSGAFLNAVMDEPAHLATCVICLLALTAVAYRPPSRPFIIAALIGSTAIDLDHIPGFFGSNALSAETSRPYGHSLLTLSIVLILAALTRRVPGRYILLGLAFGLSTHLARDMATGDGVPLLWPFSDGSARIPYLSYAAVLCGFVVLVALADPSTTEGVSRLLDRGG